MSAARWSRLAAGLEAAGLPVDVSRAGGPSSGGFSWSVTLRLVDGTSVWIHDTWWSRNAEVWCGWEVIREDLRTDLVISTTRGLKERAAVVQVVRALVNAADANRTTS